MIYKDQYKTLEDKLLILNAPDSLVHFLSEFYLKDNDIYNIEKKKPHLAFGFNIDKNVETKLITYLKVNNILVFSYDINKVKNFKQFMGYRKIIYFGLYNELKPTKDTSFIYKFEELMNVFMNIQSSVYFTLPDLIFEAGNNIYNNNSTANSTNDNRVIQYYCFLSYLIDFYKKVNKFPLNKIIIPYIINNSNHFTDSLKTTYNDKNIIIPNRQMILMSDFSKQIYDLYKNELLYSETNYCFSSNFYVNEKSISSYLKGIIKSYIEEGINDKIILDGIHINTEFYKKQLINLRTK